MHDRDKNPNREGPVTSKRVKEDTQDIKTSRSEQDSRVQIPTLPDIGNRHVASSPEAFSRM